MPEFNGGQTAVTVDGFGRQCVRGNISLVPEARKREWRVVRARVYRNGARAHHAPTALGFGLSKCSPDPGVALGHAAGVGYLIEAIRCNHRANLNWFKQYLMTRMAGGKIGAVC